MLGDPILVTVILLISAFVLLFVVYPLLPVCTQSFSRSETEMIASVKENGEWLSSAAAKAPKEASAPFLSPGEAGKALQKG